MCCVFCLLFSSLYAFFALSVNHEVWSLSNVYCYVLGAFMSKCIAAGKIKFRFLFFFCFRLFSKIYIKRMEWFYTRIETSRWLYCSLCSMLFSMWCGFYEFSVYDCSFNSKAALYINKFTAIIMSITRVHIAYAQKRICCMDWVWCASHTFWMYVHFRFSCAFFCSLLGTAVARL